jgi:hypothetical protein
MTVDPLKSNVLPQADPGGCGPTGAALHSDAHPTGESPQEANRVPSGAVSPERMLGVLRRLQQDYYSSTEVQDQVAHAVLQDLCLSRTE